MHGRLIVTIQRIGEQLHAQMDQAHQSSGDHQQKRCPSSFIIIRSVTEIQHRISADDIDPIKHFRKPVCHAVGSFRAVVSHHLLINFLLGSFGPYRLLFLTQSCYLFSDVNHFHELFKIHGSVLVRIVLGIDKSLLDPDHIVSRKSIRILELFDSSDPHITKNTAEIGFEVIRLINKNRKILLLGRIIGLRFQQFLSLFHDLFAMEIQHIKRRPAERTFKKLLIRIEVQDACTLGTCVTLQYCHFLSSLPLDLSSLFSRKILSLSSSNSVLIFVFLRSPSRLHNM